MKSLIKILCFIIILMFCKVIGNAQDLIILRNGNEIQAKVLEIKQQEITYKNWTNIDGPTYTKSKTDIFMIKYANGSKDVFEIEKNPANISSKTTGDNFIGTWNHKKYNGKTNQSVIIIKPAGSNYLVEAKMKVYLDNIWGTDYYETDGSFKEVGHFENASIIIDANTKLSLINDNTLLLRGEEYYKQKIIVNNPIKEEKKNDETKLTADDNNPTYSGEYQNGLKHGKGKITYLNGDNFEGEWKNDTINGYGINTFYVTVFGKKYKFSNKGYYYHTNKVITDSLFTMLLDDKVIQIGYFINGEKDVELQNGIIQNISSKNKIMIKIVVDGKEKTSLKLGKNEIVTEENWKSFYNKYK